MFTYPDIDPAVLDLIHNVSCAVVVGHVSPDGDCIHSQIAMGKLLQAMSVDVHLVNAGPFTRKEIKKHEPLFATHIDAELREKNPLVVVVDCSTVDRIGHIGEEIEGLTTLVIDHHASGEPFGDFSYIVTKSFSTTLCIMQLYKALEVPLTHEIAEHIFYGFATDTGYMKFIGPYRGETFHLVAELIEAGVSPNEVSTMMEGTHSLSSRKYLARLIESSYLLLEGSVLVVKETKEEFGEFAKEDRPTDTLYAQMLSVEGVQAVLYFKQGEDDLWEIGFRASHASPIDVGSIAASLGGGGHRKAAGATVAMPFDSLIATITSTIRKQTN